MIRVLRLPPHAEACPKDNMAAFCVETDGRRYVFAADKDDCLEWVERMCDIAFQVRRAASVTDRSRIRLY